MAEKNQSEILERELHYAGLSRESVLKNIATRLKIPEGELEKIGKLLIKDSQFLKLPGKTYVYEGLVVDSKEVRRVLYSAQVMFNLGCGRRESKIVIHRGEGTPAWFPSYE